VSWRCFGSRDGHVLTEVCLLCRRIGPTPTGQYKTPLITTVRPVLRSFRACDCCADVRTGVDVGVCAVTVVAYTG
jgi:hypothetical protein